jgi:hypothetical protein
VFHSPVAFQKNGALLILSLWLQLFDSHAQGLELQTKETVEKVWTDRTQQFGQRQKGNRMTQRHKINKENFSMILQTDAWKLKRALVILSTRKIISTRFSSRATNRFF